MRIRSLSRRAFGLVAFATLTHGVSAAELPSPQQLMRVGPPISLPFIPSKVLFRPTGRVFVVVSTNGISHDTTTVSAYFADRGSDAAGGASKVLQTDVLHTVDAMAFSESGNWLFLVGTSDGQGYATRLWIPDVVDTQSPPSAPIITTIKLAELPVQASIAVGGNEALYIGDPTSTRLSEVPRSAFDRAAGMENSESPVDESQHYAWGRGIHSLAISSVSEASDQLAFISYETRLKLSAIRIRGAAATTEVVDTLDGPVRSNVRGDKIVAPLAMLMTRGILSSDGKPTPSLLIGDYSSQALIIVDYDPLFQSLDIASVGAIGIPGFMLQVDSNSKLVKQPILIGSDNKQRTILVGDVYSTKLVQMARQGVSLERLGEIELSGTPTSLSVSSDGGAAIVAVAKSHDLQTLKPSIATSSMPGDDVRQLQRELSALGLNVGGIDGVIGKGTIAALGVFNSATGSNVSANDLSSALRAVSTFRQKCTTSGFGCLTNGQTK